MKKILLVNFLLLSVLLSAQNVKKVAILETVDKDGKISYATKLMVRSNIAKAITMADGYEAYDRSDMDAIMGEQNFQRTGMVSADQIKRLGEMTGANFIVVVEAVMLDERQVFLAAKILNVETALTDRSDNILLAGTSVEDISVGCEELSCKLLGLPYTSKQVTYQVQQVQPTQRASSPIERKITLKTGYEVRIKPNEDMKTEAQGKALLYFRRPYEAIGTGINYHMEVNGVYVGNLMTTHCFVIRANPGDIRVVLYPSLSSYTKAKGKGKKIEYSYYGRANEPLYIRLDEAVGQCVVEEPSKSDNYSPERLFDVETKEQIYFYQ